jgi:chromosomal replication initiation ATPase DnaA
VVAASEQHPVELDLPERLASRLAGGIAARILPFIAGERRRYVEMLARESGLALPTWALDRITGIEAPSVRVLQGATQAAIFLARHGPLEPAQLDAQLVRVAAAEASTGAFAERDVLEAVARQFELCFDDLVSQSRKTAATAARAVAAAVLQERGESLSQIGTALGRHRSTIKDLATRGRRIMDDDPALRARLTG